MFPPFVSLFFTYYFLYEEGFDMGWTSTRQTCGFRARFSSGHHGVHRCKSITSRMLSSDKDREPQKFSRSRSCHYTCSRLSTWVGRGGEGARPIPARSYSDNVIRVICVASLIAQFMLRTYDKRFILSYSRSSSDTIHSSQKLSRKSLRIIYLWTVVATLFDNQPRLQPPRGLHCWSRQGGQQLQRRFCGTVSLKKT